MDDVTSQRRLSADQIEAFYQDVFAKEQAADFAALMPPPAGGAVVDIGGGCGFFARALSTEYGYASRVIDMDPRSIEACEAAGVPGVIGDALAPPVEGDEDTVSFNFILHHLVGSTEAATRALQIKALTAWRGRAKQIFINEYIYQSFVGYLAGRLIYEITSSAVLSFIGRQAARVVPSLRANTFGVGVRFRAHEEWLKLFAEAGYTVTRVRIGEPEAVALPLRILMIKTIRRDSFRLEPA